MTRPTLSVQLRNFADQPDGWNALFDQARAADDAGIDKVVVSDHIAYGNGMDAYADPSKGGTVGGRQQGGEARHTIKKVAGAFHEEPACLIQPPVMRPASSMRPAASS